MTEQPSNPLRPPLRRSSSDRVIGGVCGGLAHTLGVDPVVVRVITAVLAILGGAGVAAYVIAWILIPDDRGENALDASRTGRGKLPQLILILVLAVAGVSIVSSLWPGRNGLGFVLFVLVAVVAWQAFGGDWARHGSFSHDATTGAQTITVDKGPDGQTVTVQTPAGTTVIRKEPKSPLGRIVWNLLIVLFGGALALDWADVLPFEPRLVLAAAIAIIGLGLVVSAFVGRARGLIALGLVATVLALPATWTGGSDVGERTWAPVASGAQSEGMDFTLGVGDATLDLRELVNGMAANSSADISADVGVGKLTVLVSASQAAHFFLQSEVGVGSITYPGAVKRSGLNQQWNYELNSPADSAFQRTIQLRLHVGIGDVEVRYA